MHGLLLFIKRVANTKFRVIVDDLDALSVNIVDPFARYRDKPPQVASKCAASFRSRYGWLGPDLLQGPQQSPIASDSCGYKYRTLLEREHAKQDFSCIKYYIIHKYISSSIWYYCPYANPSTLQSTYLSLTTIIRGSDFGLWDAMAFVNFPPPA